MQEDILSDSQVINASLTSNQQVLETTHISINLTDPNQSSKLQQLQTAYQNFQAFIKYVDEFDNSIIDIQKLRIKYKIEIHEFPTTKIDWVNISSMLPLKSPEECHIKWLALEKVSLQKIPWSNYEDQMLISIINQKGVLKWAEISKQLHEKLQQKHFRSSKQCRERWNNYLNPNIKKGDWQLEEDINLLKLAKIHGKRWAQISREMRGRNENTVKNRYNCLLKKAKKDRKSPFFTNQISMKSDSTTDTHFWEHDSFNQQEQNFVDSIMDEKIQLLQKIQTDHSGESYKKQRINYNTTTLPEYNKPHQKDYNALMEMMSQQQSAFRKKIFIYDNVDLEQVIQQNQHNFDTNQMNTYIKYQIQNQTQKPSNKFEEGSKFSNQQHIDIQLKFEQQQLQEQQQQRQQQQQQQQLQQQYESNVQQNLVFEKNMEFKQEEKNYLDEDIKFPNFQQDKRQIDDIDCDFEKMQDNQLQSFQYMKDDQSDVFNMNEISTSFVDPDQFYSYQNDNIFEQIFQINAL